MKPFLKKTSFKPNLSNPDTLITIVFRSMVPWSRWDGLGDNGRRRQERGREKKREESQRCGEGKKKP
jgi:hypothetical protein